MTGFYLKEKGLQGETSSLKRILEKYIENSTLWHFFFHFQKQFWTFHSVESVFGREKAGGREGDSFFFYVSLKCKGCNWNQLAGRHYLSILLQDSIDVKKKNRPSLNPAGTAFLLPPCCFVFKTENSSQTEIMFSKRARGLAMRDDLVYVLESEEWVSAA